MRSRILPMLALLAAATLAAAAQSAHSDLVDAKGATVGHAKLKSTADGVKISLKVSGLPAGEHAFHIHTVGKCEAPAFTSAGGHFNPTSAHHGINNPATPNPHLGDLTNIVVSEKGKAKISYLAKGVTLAEGPNSLFHEGGTALVIHAKPDDLKSDPAGNAGDRIACGVIVK